MQREGRGESRIARYDSLMQKRRTSSLAHSISLRVPPPWMLVLRWATRTTFLLSFFNFNSYGRKWSNLYRFLTRVLWCERDTFSAVEGVALAIGKVGARAASQPPLLQRNFQTFPSGRENDVKVLHYAKFESHMRGGNLRAQNLHFNYWKPPITLVQSTVERIQCNYLHSI